MGGVVSHQGFSFLMAGEMLADEPFRIGSAMKCLATVILIAVQPSQSGPSAIGFTVGNP